MSLSKPPISVDHQRHYIELMSLSFVSRAFFKTIIGAKGATKRRIEGETKSQIKIPRAGVAGDIEIVGSTRQNVSSARRRIELIVLSSRTKHQSTHFMCVPIVQPAIRESYMKFKVNYIRGNISEYLSF